MEKFEKGVLLTVIFGVLLLGFYAGNRNAKRYRSELTSYKENQSTLLSGLREYITSDSLKAVEIGVLNLRLKEYEYFRAEDVKLIKSLKVENRELQSVIATQSEMIANITTPVKDSVVVNLDNTGRATKDTLQSVDYHDDWLSFKAIIRGGEMDATIAMRDSLVIVESITYRRFLGFLWKTKRIKDRKVDAISKNPYNHIESLEKVQLVN